MAHNLTQNTDFFGAIAENRLTKRQKSDAAVLPKVDAATVAPGAADASQEANPADPAARSVQVDTSNQVEKVVDSGTNQNAPQPTPNNQDGNTPSEGTEEKEPELPVIDPVGGPQVVQNEDGDEVVQVTVKPGVGKRIKHWYSETSTWFTGAVGDVADTLASNFFTETFIPIVPVAYDFHKAHIMPRINRAAGFVGRVGTAAVTYPFKGGWWLGSKAASGVKWAAGAGINGAKSLKNYIFNR